MKYNIGDTVRVRPDLIKHKNYGGVETSSRMAKFRDHIVTITQIDTAKPITYSIKEDNEKFYWTKDMFVGIATEKGETIKPRYTIEGIPCYGTVITLEDGTRIYQSKEGHVVQLSTNSTLS